MTQTPEKPRKGDEVYSEGGQQLIYITEFDGQHMVRPLYEESNREPYYGDPFAVSRVYTKPPVEKKNAEIAKLDAEIKARRDELSAMRAEVNELSKSERERMARIQQHKGLERLDAFLAGKITHFVLVPSFGEIVIQTVADALTRNDRYSREMRLLTLYGRPNCFVGFSVNEYSDGSGSSQEVVPCCSEEDALMFARKEIAARLADPKLGGNADYIIASAIKYGVEVPLPILQNQKANKLKKLNAELLNANEKVSSIKSQIQQAS